MREFVVSGELEAFAEEEGKMRQINAFGDLLQVFNSEGAIERAELEVSKRSRNKRVVRNETQVDFGQIGASTS